MEPATNTQPEQQPEQQTQPQMQPPMQTGKSRSSARVVWVILLVLLLLGAVGFAVWQTLQLNDSNAKVSSLESSVANLQAELADAKDDSVDGDTPVNSDTDKILAAVDAYVRAPVASANLTYEYSIQETSDGFARVSVTPTEGSGSVLLLKKVDENWTVLVGGQDSPSQEIIDQYGIPAAVLD